MMAAGAAAAARVEARVEARVAEVEALRAAEPAGAGPKVEAGAAEVQAGDQTEIQQLATTRQLLQMSNPSKYLPQHHRCADASNAVVRTT